MPRITFWEDWVLESRKFCKFISSTYEIISNIMKLLNKTL